MATDLKRQIPEDAVIVHPPNGWIWLDPETSVSDLSVVNAAKVSFGERVEEMGDREIGILNFMMENSHTSPFEHGIFKFLVRAPIFVTREWFRHRTWSYNEFSTRYSEVTPDVGFYLPSTPEHMRTQVGKPGHYIFESMEGAKAVAAYQLMQGIMREALNTYLQLTGDIGLAKEVARNVLPLATYSTFVGTVNPLNLMRFLALRNHPSALREIRDYAEAIEMMFSERMPHTHNAFQRFGRLGYAETV